MLPSLNWSEASCWLKRLPRIAVLISWGGPNIEPRSDHQKTPFSIARCLLSRIVATMEQYCCVCVAMGMFCIATNTCRVVLLRIGYRCPQPVGRKLPLTEKAWTELYIYKLSLQQPDYSDEISGLANLVPIVFWKLVGLERGPLSLERTEELLGRSSSGSGLESREYGRKDSSRWPRGTLYPQIVGTNFACGLRPRSKQIIISDHHKGS
jgi:hypothetical protein